jgi:hypothetical protein
VLVWRKTIWQEEQSWALLFRFDNVGRMKSLHSSWIDIVWELLHCNCAALKCRNGIAQRSAVLGFGNAIGSSSTFLFHWAICTLWNIRGGIPREAAVNKLVLVVFASGLRHIRLVDLLEFELNRPVR